MESHVTLRRAFNRGISQLAEKLNHSVRAARSGVDTGRVLD